MLQNVQGEIYNIISTIDHTTAPASQTKSNVNIIHSIKFLAYFSLVYC